MKNMDKSDISSEKKNGYQVADLTWHKRPRSLVTGEKGKYRKAKLYETITIQIDSQGNASSED